MNRADLIRRYLAYRIAAEEAHKALKAEGRHEVEENKTVPTHRLGFATAAASVTQDHVEVTNHDEFMGYLRSTYPTEIEKVTLYRVRNHEWLRRLMDVLAELGPEDEEEGTVADAHGTVVPGVKWQKGGAFITVSVTAQGGAGRLLSRAAREAALSGDWGRFDAIVAGTVPMSPPRDDPGEEVARHAGRPIESVETL